MEPRDVTSEASVTASSSLLRLFQSEFFDAGLLLSYLYRSTMQGSQGVIDFLCNQLYQVGRHCSSGPPRLTQPRTRSPTWKWSSTCRS